MAGPCIGYFKVDGGQVEINLPVAAVGAKDCIDVAIDLAADDATAAGRQRGTEFEGEGRLVVNGKSPLQYDPGPNATAERLVMLVGLVDPGFTADADAPIVAKGEFRPTRHTVAVGVAAKLAPHAASSYSQPGELSWAGVETLAR